MAYDERLAARVREAVAVRADVTERKMFGGIAWMLGGNMAVGVRGEELIVRVDPEEHERVLGLDGVRTFDMGTRTAKGFILVAPDEVADDEGLGEWIDTGADYAATLPPKRKAG
jgi:TfoX/Sxy family transcriptional regulator of competence genes